MFNALELSEKSLSDLKEILTHLGTNPNGIKKPDLILQIIDLQKTQPEQVEKIRQELSQNKEETANEELKAEKTKRPRKVRLEPLAEENKGVSIPDETFFPETIAHKEPEPTIETTPTPTVQTPISIEKPIETQQTNPVSDSVMANKPQQQGQPMQQQQRPMHNPNQQQGQPNTLQQSNLQQQNNSPNQQINQPHHQQSRKEDLYNFDGIVNVEGVLE